MGKRKADKDKPVSQHEPTPDELDEPLAAEGVDPLEMLKGLLATPKPK